MANKHRGEVGFEADGENYILRFGANALVTEGKEFADNSLIVGAPAKAIRTLDEAAAERLRETSAHYVSNFNRFAKGLKRLD